MKNGTKKSCRPGPRLLCSQYRVYLDCDGRCPYHQFISERFQAVGSFFFSGEVISWTVLPLVSLVDFSPMFQEASSVQWSTLARSFKTAWMRKRNMAQIGPENLFVFISIIVVHLHINPPLLEWSYQLAFGGRARLSANSSRSNNAYLVNKLRSHTYYVHGKYITIIKRWLCDWLILGLYKCSLRSGSISISCTRTTWRNPACHQRRGVQ